MEYPRILVVSNNSFSKTDSNGRTLGNFFIGWPKDRLAQFCVSTDGANFELCNNYYCITDREVVNARIHLRRPQRVTIAKDKEGESKGSRGTGRKTALRMLIRDLMWGDGFWNTLDFKQWIQDFAPEVILVMFSDSSFILNIATRLSEQFDIPLVMFNTEGYYFFKHNYFRTKTKWDWLWMPVYQSRFRRQVRQTMIRVSYPIYCNSLLQEDYGREFKKDSIVLYTTSIIEWKNRDYSNELFKCSYIGNLTFGRPRALAEIADVLREINLELKLDVYGRTLKEEDERLLNNHPNILFHGFIGYDNMMQVIAESHILFHAESQEDRWHEGLKYAFSTKIADSISSGACFVLYSSPNIACAKYIQETGAGWLAVDKESLKETLYNIINDEQHRNEVLQRAKVLSSQNHNESVNCEKMLYVINKAYTHRTDKEK